MQRQFRIDKNLQRDCDKIAKKLGSNLSVEVRKLLRQFREENKDLLK